jgi:large subunit ribosomal protein L30
MAGIKVTLVKSRAGRSKDQLATLSGLGLYRMNQSRVLPDNPSTLGMCEKLKHMVVWEKVTATPAKAAPRRGAKA